jgi:hypothetical protein
VPVTFVLGRSKLFDHPDADRIKDSQHDNRDCFRCFGGGSGRGYVRRNNYVDLTIDQFGHDPVIFRIQHGLAVFDADILSLDITKFREPFLEDFKSLWIGILRRHIAHDRNCLGIGPRNLDARNLDDGRQG